MPKYKIPIYYTYYGTYEIEAKNLNEAIEKAYDETDFPTNGDYVDSSQEVAFNQIEFLNSNLSKSDLKMLDTNKE